MRVLLTLRRLRRWINRSIQRKLLVWSIIFWIISVSVISFMVLLFGRNEITLETRQRNVQLASVISRDINAQISGIFSDIRIFTQHLETTNPDLDSQADAILSLRLSSPQRYQAIYYFDGKGTLLLHLKDNLQYLLSMKSASEIVSRPAITLDRAVTNASRMTNGTMTYISEVQFSGIDNIPILYVGVPIGFSDGENRIIIFEIDLRDIWQRIDLNTIGQSGFTYAVSRQGSVIAHPDPAFIGRSIPTEIGPLLQGYEGFTEYGEPFSKSDVIAAYSPVGSATGWGIVIVQDKSEAYARLIRNGVVVVFVWLVLAALGTVGILVMVRSFTQPIMDLTRTTRAIAQTGDLTKTATVSRQDEVGQLSQAFEQMIERLQRSESRLAQAAAEERNRLARDLHDAVSQTLFSASLIAEVLPRIWERNNDEGRRRLAELRQLTRGALAEMRTLLLELRPSALGEAEFAVLLHQLGEAITGRSRIPVTVEVEGECPVPNDVKIALYRISQEALNNVAKHSGAKNAGVHLACSVDRITLQISDNGKGFDVADNAHKSLGMGIIRERAKEIGANLSIKSSQGQGTEITVVWENQKAGADSPPIV